MRKIQFDELLRPRMRKAQTRLEVADAAGFAQLLDGTSAQGASSGSSAQLLTTAISGLQTGGASSSIQTAAGQSILPAFVNGANGADAPQQVTAQISALVQQMRQLTDVQQQQSDKTAQNTQALVQNTVAKASGTSAAATAGHVASSVFGGALGSLSPILSGLIGLFGGGGAKQADIPAVQFALPPAIAYQGGYAANTGSVAPVDHAQGGQVRSAAAPASANVNIQVNAMDSRSFLDHSDDIARAVRQAMLNSSSLNDVIADL